MQKPKFVIISLALSATPKYVILWTNNKLPF